MAKRKAVAGWLREFTAKLRRTPHGILSEFSEILAAGGDGLIDIGAAVVSGIDDTGDMIEWSFTKASVNFLRRVHDMRMAAIRDKKLIIGTSIYFIMSGVIMLGMFAAAIDYQYSYNGKPLGIVREQKDVVEIMGLVSEELAQEYGLSINIDPKTDIKFTPVISYGKPIDDANTVLKRFTYMGDVQTKAYSIEVGNQMVGVVESEAAAKDILQTVIDRYLDGDNKKYEYVGIAEQVDINEVTTKLAMINSRSSVLKTIDAGKTITKKYRVKKGDRIKYILKKFNMSFEDLAILNPDIAKTKEISRNQVLNIAQSEPVINVETVEVKTFAEVLDYDVDYVDSDRFYEGESFTTREGRKGKQKVTARLTKVNGETMGREDLDREVIISPVNKVVTRGTKKVPPRKGTGTFIRPVSVPIYSGFGWRWGRMHQGIDLPSAVGTPIHAADGGTVTMAGWYYNYGYTLIVDHGGGYQTLYGHCSSLYVSVGDKVFQGQTIAAMGNTGRSTGSHLHFEIHKNGRAVNPADYV